MPSHLLLLHDVAADTYSRDLIPVTGVRNLHHLFAVSPRWYNRSKDRHGDVVVVRFKNATPRRDIHMVDLQHASRRVRRAAAGALVGGVKLQAIARVGGAIALAGIAIHLADAHIKKTQLRETLKLQQQLDNQCLQRLKKEIGERNTHPEVRKGCEPKFKNETLTKGNVLGEGQYGKVYAAVGKNGVVSDEVVIKEQTALCFQFYNEVGCLDALRYSSVTPKLYDAYICSPSSPIDTAENSQITYGYVMQKLESSLVDFINNTEDNKLEDELDTIANRLYGIFVKLDDMHIFHRDLHLANFMITFEGGHRVNYMKIYVVDFGNARFSKSETNRFYSQPLLDPVEPLPNWKQFVLTQASVYGVCKKGVVVANKSVCTKPEVALRLAKKILEMHLRSDADKVWREIEKNFGLPSNLLPIL